MAASRNSKGPYVARLYGYKFGAGPSKKCLTVTAAREWAESFGSGAKFCAIMDRSMMVVGKHVRGEHGWGRA